MTGHGVDDERHPGVAIHDGHHERRSQRAGGPDHRWKGHPPSLRAEVAKSVLRRWSNATDCSPRAVVLVGEDPASHVYVRNKAQQTREVGMHSLEIRLPASTAQSELLERIAALNVDPLVHGILVQLPLPPQIDATAVIEAIAPAKDVDGFHPINIGLLASRGAGSCRARRSAACCCSSRSWRRSRDCVP